MSLWGRNSQHPEVGMEPPGPSYLQRVRVEMRVHVLGELEERRGTPVSSSNFSCSKDRSQETERWLCTKSPETKPDRLSLIPRTDKVVL